PTAGAGAVGGIPDGASTGWDPAWNPNLPGDTSAVQSALKCNSMYQTWTDTRGNNENRAIVCVSWYQTVAFCIWDGGRLPSETQWNYAAAGGSEQRPYPWGAAAPAPIYASYGVPVGVCWG